MKSELGAVWKFRIARLVFWLIILGFVSSGLLFLSFRLLLHSAHESLQSKPHPASGYAEAVTRFQKIQANEGQELNPVCHSILLTHGQRTEKAAVFFHGYTNCPDQFRDLGRIFYDMGYNVLIPRLPRHGLADRKVENLTPLKAEELRDCADTSVDIACGLSQNVYVAGLSAGGTLTAWIAQNRSEVTRAVLIAPALGLPIALDDDLQEIGVGEADGMQVAAFFATFGEPDFERDPYRPLAPGGESWARFVLRVAETLNRIAREHSGKTIVLVTHGGIVDGAFLCFLGVGLFEMRHASFHTYNT